ncbi:four-carbon acid sugar kinase family protein [Serratia ureilytica]
MQNGLPTVQLNGVPQDEPPVSAQAAVISLKSRSLPGRAGGRTVVAGAGLAAKTGTAAGSLLLPATAPRRGNIGGPVTDALLRRALGKVSCGISGVADDGRTVYQGPPVRPEEQLLLSESGMRHHPVTPMTDGNLLRLMESGHRARGW